ncbi:hypothetical protein Sjap_003026 [Stephania japonica]|uniref:Uncharacterized protein n=1 Tax=Stephania japonica TaxID=461633 RepID=A0AAP0PWP3_9MAGN
MRELREKGGEGGEGELVGPMVSSRSGGWDVMWTRLIELPQPAHLPCARSMNTTTMLVLSISLAAVIVLSIAPSKIESPQRHIYDHVCLIEELDPKVTQLCLFPCLLYLRKYKRREQWYELRRKASKLWLIFSFQATAGGIGGLESGVVGVDEEEDEDSEASGEIDNLGS